MNDEIAEGIKFAMSKGETLQRAMQSFYNAGYLKQEVEEAARTLQNQLHLESEMGIHAVLPNLRISSQNQGMKNEMPQAGGEIPSMQKVSSYDSSNSEENPRRKMIILVSVLLGVMVLVFAGIFFFRDYLLQLFGRIFG